MTDSLLDFHNWPTALACTYGPYRARVQKVTDGDTFRAVVDMGLRAYVVARIRIDRINAPEKDEAGGAAATAFLSGILPQGMPVRITTYGYDRWERWISLVELEVFRDGVPTVRSVGDMLVESGHAIVRTYG